MQIIQDRTGSFVFNIIRVNFVFALADYAPLLPILKSLNRSLEQSELKLGYYNYIIILIINLIIVVHSSFFRFTIKDML